APIATYTASNGLVVASYDDAVTPKSMADTLALGSFVGSEAASATIRFDYGSTSTTSISVAQLNGKYTDYAAASYISWSSCLDHGEQTLFHEYGHAWSLYYAYMVQQDP